MCFKILLNPNFILMFVSPSPLSPNVTLHVFCFVFNYCMTLVVLAQIYFSIKPIISSYNATLSHNHIISKKTRGCVHNYVLLMHALLS